MSSDVISSTDLLIRLQSAVQNEIPTSADSLLRVLDVRSEGEFAQAALPQTANVPILQDQERHMVGLAYKKEGKEKAIELGHRLVGPLRPERVLAWTEYLKDAGFPVVMCWRGGLRSQIAASWIREAGRSVVTVKGGYKAVRTELTGALAAFPSLLVLSGLTGSGKTRLLRELRVPKIDLEAYANHRGSSFGGWMKRPQPSQATFENRIACQVWNRKETWLVEDESTLIGNLAVPTALKAKMKISEVIVLDTPMCDRVSWIHQEYVSEPIKQGHNAGQVHDNLSQALMRIRKKLGDQKFTEVMGLLNQAFASNAGKGFADWEPHAAWIENLLVHYYDKQYLHSFNRQERKVVFRGGHEECRQWIQSKK